MKGYRFIKALLVSMALVLFMAGSGWSYSITLSYDAWWGAAPTTNYTYDEPRVVATSVIVPTYYVLAVSTELNKAVTEAPNNDFVDNGDGGTNGGPAPVPEPSTLILLGAGLVGAALLRKKMA